MKIGDTVTRIIAGDLNMPLKITAITPTLIYCGPWSFCRFTGAEIDAELNWGPPPLMTGSRIQLPKESNEDDTRRAS